MKNVITASIVALAAAATNASAATLALNSYSNALGNSDTRPNGSTTNLSTTVDGTHPLVGLTTTESGNLVSPNPEKVAPFFSTGTFPTPIGTLGDLGRGSLTLDYLFNSRGATTPSFVGNIAAFRILVGRPDVSPTASAEIIYETAYQSIAPVAAAGVGIDDLNIGAGNFYARYSGANFGDGNNGPVNPLTLAQLAAGGQLTPTAYQFNDSTPIYGLAVSIGSDSGDFSAAVGDINATFTAVPEPTTLAVLGGVAVLALHRRRRQA